MSSVRRLLYAIAFSIPLLPGTAYSEIALGQAGYVTGTFLGGGKVTVNRIGTQPFTPKPGTAIMEGDEIMISGKASVSVDSNDPKLSGQFNYLDSPLVFVAHTKPKPELWSVILSALAQQGITNEQLNRRPAVSAQVKSKGTDNCPNTDTKSTLRRGPYLESDVQQVERASVPLVLTWRGGAGPYYISYFYNNKWYGLGSGYVCDPYVIEQPPSWMYQNGVAHIRIVDAKKAELDWTLEIAPSLRATGPQVSTSPDPYLDISQSISELSNSRTTLGVSSLAKLYAAQGQSFLAWRYLSGALSGEWDAPASK